MMNLNNMRVRRTRRVCLTDGGQAALNFINTFRQDARGGHYEGLADYAGFIWWCQASGLLDWEHYLVLDAEAYCYRHEAAAVLEEALTMRALLRDLFTQLADGHEPDEFTLRYLDRQKQEVQARLGYRVGSRGVEQYWLNSDEELKAPLWMIMAWADKLLTSADVAKIKQCPACAALFVDVSRRGNRRWCNPQTCGSLQKSKQYYARKIGKGISLENGSENSSKASTI
jgi:predicted RNA-binding Zn ribbon-like protein